MDILIDLIIYLIKQASGAGSAKTPPLNPPQAARQRAALQQQILAMQQGPSPRKVAGAKFPAGRAIAARPPALPKKASPTLTPQVPPVETPIVVTRMPRGIVRAQAVPAMRFPFILGEILSPPIALRVPEF